MAVVMATFLCLLPACSAPELVERSNERAEWTAPSLATEGELTAPVYYTPSETEPSDPIYTPERQLKLLADRDFGATYFIIVVEKGFENAVFPASDDLLNGYADSRNLLVQEKYNVELISRQMTAEEIITELSVNAHAGVYFCDLLIVSPSLLKQLQEKDLLVALDTLPFFESDSACINTQATEEINVGWDGIYGIWGDALRQPNRQLCVYYNRTLAESLGCPNFYAAVRSGSWDFETLLSWAESEAGGILYDGKAEDLLFGASGLSSASDDGKALLSDPDFRAAVDRLNTLLLPASEEDSDSFTRFVSGESLFYIGTQDKIEALSQVDLAYGFLPIPKYDLSAAEYPTLTEQSELPVFACPANVSTAAGTGVLLSALNAASCDEVNEIFLERIAPFVRDNGSTLMIPYLIGDIHFDRKLIFSEKTS